MSESELESAISILQVCGTSRNVLNALILIRQKVDWPRGQENVAILRSKGCLKQLTHILVKSPHKSCIDTSLSILGNCLMDRACTSEVGSQHNILSVLNQLLKKYPKDDSINGRTLRIIGNMCQHRDQWANIIIDRKPALVVNAVDIVNRASKDELSEGDKISDATIITSLRVFRELLNCNTVMTLVKNMGVLKAVGCLFIKYSNDWRENKTNEKIVLDIVRVIHEYSKYKYYHSILEMRNTERGDSLLHLTTVLILAPKRIVKIIMNFIKSCQLKSELPVNEICTKFIEVLENHSITEELPSNYTEYLQCFCLLLDHPANRNAERCGKAVPLLIKVLKELDQPSNNVVESCVMLLNTLNKFKYDPKLLLDQLQNGIVPVLIEKLTWLVGAPDSLNLKHLSEKKRKYYAHSSPIVKVKKKRIEGDLPRECILKSPSPSSSDDETDMLYDRFLNRICNRYDRSPSSCSNSSDGNPPLSWGEASSSCSPAPSLVDESDSDNYSPVCSESDERDFPLPNPLDDYSDPAPPVPDLDDSMDNDDTLEEVEESNQAVCDTLKIELMMEIMKLVKSYIQLKPAVPQLVNLDLFMQLTKCALKNTYDLEMFCDLLSNHEYIIPLMQTDFVHIICSIRDSLPAHEFCFKCSINNHVTASILNKISEVAESAAGRGEIAHKLMRGDTKLKQKIVMVIPYVIRNRSILGKFMLNCGGLEILMTMLRHRNEQENRRSLKTLCQMASHRLLIANPRELSNTLNKPKIVANKYKPPEPHKNIVSFVLDDESVVKADRDFLSAKSDFFNGLLNGHFKESTESEVVLAKVDSKSFKCLLHLLENVDRTETIEIDLDLDALLDVIMLCDRFLLTELCMALTDSVEQYRITTKTVPMIYNWSVESATNLLRVESVAYALVVRVDEKERFSMFENLFRLGCKDQLLEDMQNLLVRYLTLSDYNQRVRDLYGKRKNMKDRMRDQLLKEYV